MSTDTSLDAAVPPPLQHVPTAKEKKYDRQLRLWGAAGQIALEDSHILLINNGSGVTGVETLKNLVLPGVGHFSILDSALVAERDLGVNFFLEPSSLGKFRAEETVRCLLELNPGVRGEAITEPLETFVAQDKVFAKYTLILLVAPVDPAILSLIRSHAEALDTPLFYLHSFGFYSCFSVQLPRAFPVVDTHPDPTATTDLRLLKPWPALIAFAREKTRFLGTGDIAQHDKGHIPYVALLLHYLAEWREKHDGNAPDSYKEKSEFRAQVRAGDANEENFDEACANVLKCLNPPTAPSAVRDILAAPETQRENIDATTASFWLIANAVQHFYSTHGELPLPGAVPDMKAQSADYIQLQNIYKRKARQDCAEVLAQVRELERDTGRASALAVDEKEVENFCRGAAHIHLVRGRPIPITQPGQPPDFGDRAKALAMELTNPESLIGLYLAFCAWDAYVATHATPDPGHARAPVPGAADADVAADAAKLTGVAHRLVDGLITQAGLHLDEPEYGELRTRVGQTCVEMARAGGEELHNTAALAGGLVAQEVIKVITRQYVPVDNTCVFDGIASRTYVLRV